MIKYTDEDIQHILDIVSNNPQGFLSLVNNLCKKVTVYEVERSMIAWGIDPTRGFAPSTSDRTARGRKNHRN